MLCDFKIVSIVIQIEAFRCVDLFHQITAVSQLTHLINAGTNFNECSQLFILSVQLLVAICITINLKLCAGQLIIRVISIHFRKLHGTANQRILDFYLNHSAVFVNIHFISLFRQHITCRSFYFTDNPVAKRNFGKRKTAVLCGGGSQNCSIGCKFFGVRCKQANQRTTQGISAIILFHTLHFTVNQVVFNGSSVICLDLYKSRILSGIFKYHRVLGIGQHIVTIRGDLFQIIAAKRKVRLAGSHSVCIHGEDFQQTVCRDNRTVRGS